MTLADFRLKVDNVMQLTSVLVSESGDGLYGWYRYHSPSAVPLCELCFENTKSGWRITGAHAFGDLVSGDEFHRLHGLPG